ncbi:MAG: hypothetical protein ACM3MG_11285 [Bacillota bacterium]
MMKLLFTTILLFGSFSFAGGYPACKDKNQLVDLSNDSIVKWRDNMPAKFLARAFVQAKIVGVLEDRQNHIHFEVDLDGDFSTTDDRLEVIYNTEFGAVPEFHQGDSLIACGDFIVDPYSPTKAVLHWVHKNPKNTGHDDGYLVINGILTGQVTQ